MAVPQTMGVVEHSEKVTEDGPILDGGKPAKDGPEGTTDEVVAPTNGKPIEEKTTSPKQAWYIAVTTLGLMTAVLLVALDTNILGGLRSYAPSPLTWSCFGTSEVDIHII